MSNTLGIATVTGVFGARLATHLDQAGLNFPVTLTHPSDADTAGVYLHLYNVMPNAALRNESLPERGRGGDVSRLPRLAVDLYYQISFVGAPASLDCERLAGACMTGLHAFPRFAPEEIASFLAAQPGGGPLAAADLADQLEQVRVTPLSSDIEDLSRLWSMTQRNFHRLSVLYRASSVMLEPEIRHSAALPVTTPAVTVYTLRQPRIDSIVSSERQQAIVVFGETLIVRGSALSGDDTRLHFASSSLAPSVESDVELRVVLDDVAGLASGVYAVQVRHRIEVPNGEFRPGPESNTIPVAVAPALDSPQISSATVDGATTIRLRPQPMPAVEQKLELNLLEVGGEGRHTSTQATIDDSGADDELVFTMSVELPAATYLVRLMVDGASTLFTTDNDSESPTFGNFVGPSVTIT